MTLESIYWQPLPPLAETIQSRFGTPAYVYNTSVLAHRSQQLNNLFSQNFSISYAVKANPNHHVLKLLHSQVDTFDVSSLGEVQRVLDANITADRITFSGPAKRDIEIESAIQLNVGEIVVESLDEAHRIASLCKRLRKNQKVMVRITPSNTPRQFGASMAGKASQFGIDEEQLPQVLPEILALEGIEVCGLHIYSGSNCLSVDALLENFRLMIDCFSDAAQIGQFTPEKLIFGAGFGLPYLESDTELDIESVSIKVNQLINDFRNNPKFKNCQCTLELGRWLVGPAGVLLSSVVSEKNSKGKHIRLCDAGFNNHLAAFGLMGTVIRRNWKIHNISRQTPQTATYNLVGPLCTAIDVMAQEIELPLTERGDVLAIENSGAYGFTASPIGFISHPAPKELALTGNQILDISEPLTITNTPPTPVLAVES